MTIIKLFFRGLIVWQTGAAGCRSGHRRGSGLVQALWALKNIRLLWPGVIWGPGIPLPRLFVVIIHLFFHCKDGCGRVPHPRRRPGREDALRWVHGLCLLQQGYDGEMAVRSAACTDAPVHASAMNSLCHVSSLFDSIRVTLAPTCTDLFFFIAHLLIGLSADLKSRFSAFRRWLLLFLWPRGCGVTLRDVTVGVNGCRRDACSSTALCTKVESCSVVGLRGLCSSAGGH